MNKQDEDSENILILLSLSCLSCQVIVRPSKYFFITKITPRNLQISPSKENCLET